MHKFEKMLTGSYGDYVHEVHEVADIILQLWGVESDKDVLKVAVEVSRNMDCEERISLLTYVQEIQLITDKQGWIINVPLRRLDWVDDDDGWCLRADGKYLTDAHQPSDEAQRGAMLARLIAGSPSIQLLRETQVTERKALEFYEVRGNFVLLKSGGEGWNSIINLTNVHRINWDRQVLIFSGTPNTSVNLGTQISTQIKQEILKGIFESITNVCSRGSVAGVSNE